MTVSAVAEQVPTCFSRSFILPGSLVPNGMPLLAMVQHETLSSGLPPRLFVGDPAVIGAIRINVRSTDEATGRYSKLRFMATCRSPNSRMRRRNFIATNRAPAR